MAPCKTDSGLARPTRPTCQIAPANAAFSPSPDEIAWAGKVARAFAAPEAAGKGAIRFEGRMLERLHLREAERMLALADARPAAGL